MLRNLAPLLLTVPFLLSAAPKNVKTPTDHYALGLESFNQYDYDKAREHVANFLKTAKTPTDREKGEALARRVELGAAMLDRVEQIQIIDSIIVPIDDIYKAMRLAPSAGSLRQSSAVEVLGDSIIANEPVYVTEAADDMVWVGTMGEEEATTMYEAVKLADGTWEQRRMFDYPSIFGEDSGTDVDYPFMMNDGVTLYFAADGDSSLGGYDIFIARRDEDGFLQPSNIGMPYNSPYNDFLYAIDEERNIGYWATDRNAAEGMATVYTFIPNEQRVNYPIDAPDLVARAAVTSIAMTMQDGEGYIPLDEDIDIEVAKGKEKEFEFSLPGQRVYTNMSDFKSTNARRAMERYLDTKASLVAAQTKLARMREQYRQGNKSKASEILELERQIDQARSTLKNLANDVVRAEK